MKLREVMAYADELRPNDFSESMKVQWLNEIEGMVQTNVMLLTQGADMTSYTWEEHQDTEMLAKFPHDKIYWAYLIAMIDYANGDLDKYQNDMALFNERWGEYMRWYARTYRPADGEMVAHGYYLSAYSIAVMHGFDGTEEQWLESLVGPQGAAFTYDDFTEEQLASLKGPQGEKGTDGYTPVKGADYYTEDEKRELLEELAEKSEGIFIAEYDVTTWEELCKQSDAGKALYCKKEGSDPGEYYLIPLYEKTDNVATFCIVSNNAIMTTHLAREGVRNSWWDYESTTIQDSHKHTIANVTGLEARLAEIEDAVDQTDELIDEAITKAEQALTKDNVFVAEFDVTSWVDVTAAWNAGKALFCTRGKYRMPLYSKDENIALFRTSSRESVLTCKLTKYDTWDYDTARHPESHTHTIADVTGLQSSINSISSRASQAAAQAKEADEKVDQLAADAEELVTAVEDLEGRLTEAESAASEATAQAKATDEKVEKLIAEMEGLQVIAKFK